MLLREIPNFTPENQSPDGAVCSFCGHSPRQYRDGSRERVFSTGLHIHMEGVIEVCETCLTQGGTAVGMVQSDVADALKADVSRLLTAVEEVEDERDEARVTVGSLTRELARVEDEAGAKIAASYEKGYDQGSADEKGAVSADA